MLLAAARTLVAHRSLFEAVVERLRAAARRAGRGLFKAYVKYMIRELARIFALNGATVNALGVEDLGVEWCAAEVLGRHLIELAVRLDEALERLSRRVDRAALSSFMMAAERVLRIASLQEVACARAVEFVGGAPRAALLKRMARRLLRLADDLRLMRGPLLARRGCRSASCERARTEAWRLEREGGGDS
jgi:hypothetical protein